MNWFKLFKRKQFKTFQLKSSGISGDGFNGDELDNLLNSGWKIEKIINLSWKQNSASTAINPLGSSIIFLSKRV